MTQIHQIWSGIVPYANSLATQHLLAARVRLHHECWLLGCEHPRVITLGRRANFQKDVLLDLPQLEKLGVQVVPVERGGQTTLHNPGQLVIYPIINLKTFSLRPRVWVELLLEVSRRTCLDFGLKTSALESTAGLHSEIGKVVSLGLRIHQGVSTHGLSVNVSNHLEDFHWIRACGKAQAPLDQLARVHRDGISTQDFFWIWCQHWKLALDNSL